MKNLSLLGRRRSFWLLILATIAIAAYLCRARLFLAAGDFLVIRDQLEPADLILLLNGDFTLRPAHAAVLYNDGLARAVIIARAQDSAPVKLGAYPNVTDSSIGVLRRLGVPQERIIELRPPGGVSHTSDEAKAVLNYYRDNPFRKLIVVTSDLHSRRAKFTFERFLKGKPVKIMLAPVTDLKYGADNWWRSEDGIIGCQEEYIKLFYYHVRFQN